MQLNMTINASPELLAVLTGIAQALNSHEVQKESGQAGASQGVPELIRTPKTMASVGEQYRSASATKIDCTDLTLEEIRSKAAQINSAGFGQEIRALLKRHSVSSISALPESNFAAFFEALAALDTANTQQVAGDDIRYY